MIDAVFISDLHLHPEHDEITQRFDAFVAWALKNTKSVYILGDFFHVWSGDDCLDAWSRGIAQQLAQFAEQGIALYFMRGNRDFLLGSQFIELAQATCLSEPVVITLGEESVLLAHGDRYCTRDRGHQWLRRLTRNFWFPALFLRLPRSIRVRLTQAVRYRSKQGRGKPASVLDTVPRALLKEMVHYQVSILIHGHTHRPGLIAHQYQKQRYWQYILSDWDEPPYILCYNEPVGFYFNLFSEVH